MKALLNQHQDLDIPVIKYPKINHIILFNRKEKLQPKWKDKVNSSEIMRERGDKTIIQHSQNNTT